MFVVRALASIVFVFLPLSATAQITLSPDDLRLSLGMTWEQETAVAFSSLEETGFDIGSAGADQSFDLTGSLANSILTFSGSSAVIPLDQAPDAASFPDADYAVRIITTVPNATGGTDEIETYGYFQRSAAGDVLVGVGGPDGQVPIPLVDIETPWPLEFGKSWTAENISWEDQILSALGMVGPELLLAELLLPEETISGQLDLQFAVDAWGEVQLPAGTFDCLRLHQTGTIVLSLEGSDQFASLGETTFEIDSYAWAARGIGTVAIVEETRQTFASGNIPPITISQISRLTEISSPASAVAATSWGALKQKFAE